MGRPIYGIYGHGLPPGFSGRAETRIPCSKATKKFLSQYKREGEPYDVLIRRMMISGIPKSLDTLTPAERQWVLLNH